MLLVGCLMWQLMLAQDHPHLLSGPMLGNVELRNISIWVEVKPEVKKVGVRYKAIDGKQSSQGEVYFKGELGKEFNPVKIELNGLLMSTRYQYEILLDDDVVKHSTFQFSTKDLWQWRKPTPDVAFLTGSCAYFNEPIYDRPGIPYGGDSSIFETMAKFPANFTVWLGDNWYTREVDYYTVWGMNYRPSLDRSRKVLQPLLRSMPHYFIWDDHDFGPNDAGTDFIYKKESREIFRNYTLNPSYGYQDEGIYTKFSYSDVDVFMTDNRYFRSHARYPDSINGQPNPNKTYFGRQQLEWLKNALLSSRATFKIIATGSQVLNFSTTYDCMCHYSYEFRELMNFIKEAKVEGVIFLSGDRHHSEVIKYEQPGMYTLYDMTVSPFTAGVGKVRGQELENPNRIKGTLIEDRNFGRVSVTGKRGERKLQIDYHGLKGEKLATWEISEQALKFK